MTTTRFQPGDKVRVKTRAWAAELGLAVNVTYTVAHVDDFGQISLRGISLYYHASHFELVMRAVPDETPCYSLKDGEGDWWVFDTVADHWWCETHSGALPRAKFEGGIEQIATDFDGIDAEPLPAVKGMEPTHAEVDEVQRWPGNSTGPSLHFEAAPEPIREGDRVKVARTAATAASHGYTDEMCDVGDEFTVTAVGTNGHGPYARGDGSYWWHTDDLEKASPTPLAVGDWVKVLARVEHVFDNGSIKAQTFQSDGTDNGPSVYAVESAITRTDEVPEWVVEEQKAESEAISNITATLRREGGMDYDAAHDVAASLFRAGVRVEVTER